MARKINIILIGTVLCFLMYVPACVHKPVSRSTAGMNGTLCIGSDRAKKFAIYLHGQDSVEPSELEINNRKNLAHLAEVLDFKIAMPRATQACPNKPNLLCWGWKFDQKVAEQSLPLLKKAAEDCFPEASEVSLIGFSSGGYLVNQIYQDQLLKKINFRPQFLLSIGSTFGSWSAIDENKNFSSKIPLVFLIGLQDTYNRDLKNAYLNFLQTHAANVSEISFVGGHIVPDEPMISVIRSLLENH